MRVLQIIDTLDAGGAERMAVNYANALSKHIEASHICCTRREGILKRELSKNVHYLFLKKQSSFDLLAFFKLKNYIRSQKIDIIHAHSTSFFFATLIRIYIGNNIKLFWHDHYGKSEFLEARPKLILCLFSNYFDGVLSVNIKLAEWADKNLRAKKVQVFWNFLSSKAENEISQVKLQGNVEDFKFICVANLRPQKDHINLIRAFEKLNQKNVSLHLIGKDFHDEYSQKIHNYIESSAKKNSIFLYGSREHVNTYLNKADAGVLASVSEGLPLALLEYGLAGLPVICTDVGECKNIIGDTGIIIEPSNSNSLATSMEIIYKKDFNFNPADLRKKIKNEYSENAIIPKILNFYSSI